MVKLLVKAGVRNYVNIRNDKGQTPLHIAAASKNRRVYRYLVSKGAQIDALDQTGKWAFPCDDMLAASRTPLLCIDLLRPVTKQERLELIREGFCKKKTH